MGMLVCSHPLIVAAVAQVEAGSYSDTITVTLTY